VLVVIEFILDELALQWPYEGPCLRKKKKKKKKKKKERIRLGEKIASKQMAFCEKIAFQKNDFI